MTFHENHPYTDPLPAVAGKGTVLRERKNGSDDGIAVVDGDDASE